MTAVKRLLHILFGLVAFSVVFSQPKTAKLNAEDLHQEDIRIGIEARRTNSNAGPRKLVAKRVELFKKNPDSDIAAFGLVSLEPWMWHFELPLLEHGREIYKARELVKRSRDPRVQTISIIYLATDSRGSVDEALVAKLLKKFPGDRSLLGSISSAYTVDLKKNWREALRFAGLAIQAEPGNSSPWYWRSRLNAMVAGLTLDPKFLEDAKRDNKMYRSLPAYKPAQKYLSDWNDTLIADARKKIKEKKSKKK